MSSVAPLARLEKVNLRAAWPHEATNFTRWLAEPQNIALLAEEIGVPLICETVEKEVGPFSADILAKEADTERWVIIENQLTPTDHGHLGQLLTYAAGLEARTVIWIAEEFREEHRAAIDFLNRATTEEFAFFGVRIELYRIGDSPLAPAFSILAKPNDWSKRTQSAKQAAASVEENESRALWKEYWTTLIAAARGRYQALAGRSPYRGNYQTFETLRGGDPSFAVNATFSWDKGLRIEIYIDGLQAKQAFSALKAQKDVIETSFGHPLDWEELPEARASRIAFYMPGKQTREDRDAWNKQHDWLIEYAPKLAALFRPLVAALKLT
jgi:hypothetical protein